MHTLSLKFLVLHAGNSNIDAGTSKPLCAFQKITRITKGIKMMCRKAVQGRYVKISFTKDVPDDEELELCEVEVYAKGIQ